MLKRNPPPSNCDSSSQEQKDPDCQLKPYALVVDDSADIAFMLLMILQHSGYDGVMALSATEALALAKREHFNLVISDIGMPAMNGYELAGALRALPGYATIPMIAITGFAQYDDRDRALDAGFDTYVKKPVDPQELIDLIRHFR